MVGIQISTELDATSGVVAADQLDEVAQLGGAALDGERKFYSVEDQAALSAALDSITADLGCTMDLGEEVDPERESALRVAGELTDEISDCASEDGWLFSEDGTSIQLCGQACSDFQASGEILFELRLRVGRAHRGSARARIGACTPSSSLALALEQEQRTADGRDPRSARVRPRLARRARAPGEPPARPALG